MAKETTREKTLDEAIIETQQLVDYYREQLDVLLRAKRVLSGSKAERPVPERTPTFREVRSAAAVRANIVRRLPHPRAGKFDPTSGIGHTVAILGEESKPLHISDILNRIEARTGKRPKITSLIGSIAQLARDRKIFYREQPGTYGLIEWKVKGAD